MNVKLTTSIPIPTKLRKSWQGEFVFIEGGNETIVVKKMHRLDSDLLKRLKIVGRSMKKSDLSRAIKSART